MPWAKGKSGNPHGRPRGAKNKVPGSLRDKVLAINEALDAQGKGLLDMAEADPRWFHSLFTRALLPRHVDAEVTMPQPLIISGVVHK